MEEDPKNPKSCCSSCGTIYLKGERFCVFDGTALVISPRLDISSMGVCPKCQAQFNGKKFCPFHGVPLNEYLPPGEDSGFIAAAPVAAEDKSPTRKFAEIAASARNASQDAPSPSGTVAKKMVLKSATKVGLMSNVMTVQEKFREKGFTATILQIKSLPDETFQAELLIEMIPYAQVDLQSPPPRQPAPAPTPPPRDTTPSPPTPPSQERTMMATSSTVTKKMIIKGPSQAALMATIETMQNKFWASGIELKVLEVSEMADGSWRARLQFIGQHDVATQPPSNIASRSGSPDAALARMTQSSMGMARKKMILKGTTRPGLMMSIETMQAKFSAKGIHLSVLEITESSEGGFQAKLQLGMAEDSLTGQIESVAILQGYLRRLMPCLRYRSMRVTMLAQMKAGALLGRALKRSSKQRKFRTVMAHAKRMMQSAKVSVLQAFLRRHLVKFPDLTLSWDKYLKNIKVISKYFKAAVARRRLKQASMDLSRHARAASTRATVGRLLLLIDRSRKIPSPAPPKLSLEIAPVGTPPVATNSTIFRPPNFGDKLKLATSTQKRTDSTIDNARSAIAQSKGMFQSEDHVIQYLNAITYTAASTPTPSSKTPTPLWPSALRSASKISKLPLHSIPLTPPGGGWDAIGSMSKPAGSSGMARASRTYPDHPNLRSSRDSNASESSGGTTPRSAKDGDTVWMQSDPSKSTYEVRSTGAFASKVAKRITPRR